MKLKIPKLSKRGYLFVGAIAFAVLAPVIGILFGTGIIPAAWASIVLLIAGTANGIVNYKKAQNATFFLATIGMAIATTTMAAMLTANTMLQTIASYLALFIVPTAVILSIIAIYKMTK